MTLSCQKSSEGFLGLGEPVFKKYAPVWHKLVLFATGLHPAYPPQAAGESSYLDLTSSAMTHPR